jgi:hypothetical protein
MPDVEVALLPLCIGLGLLGVVVAVIAFARGRRGRALQGLAFALGVVALYLTGLLRLVWDAVVALVRWATGNVFDLWAWIGFGALALAVVLWVVGGVVARRSRRRSRAVAAENKGQPQLATGRTAAAPTGRGAAKPQQAGRASAQKPAQDEDMAEIEALLKSRGIQ